ncbi:hypothetical protein [Streptomyces rubradiris]|uniref:hypothetical protein n=1 Tax=Streptomyces rubradiris TaxID=285531 RepID=UPI001E54BC56|nr:hypothetical protein [Streptomyces rubradiris]
MRGRGGTARGRGGAAARCAVVVLLLGLWSLVAPTAAPTAAARADPPAGDAYAFTPGARTVVGAPDTAGAVLLDARHTYRSSLPRAARLYYRLRLTAAETAYVPVTAVPPPDAAVSATDGIRVSLRNANGTSCSYASARFGAGISPRPVTALGQRETGKALCQGSGTYYLLVERLDTGRADATAGAARWDLEIAPVTEPGLVRAGSTTPPRDWDSASPEPPSGRPRERSGGTGFATARTVGQGVWRTALSPGETRFYKVPVDWGQRLHASAELGGAQGHGYVGGALTLSLHNPVRGAVDDSSAGYTGTAKPTALAPLPPVEYANRYAVPAGVTSVRFAGDYYLVVHLSTRLAEPFGQGPYEVTLRVRVDGRAHAGPAYDGGPVPKDVFEISDADRAAALTGGLGSVVTPAAEGRGDGDGDGVMRLVAVGGIGSGTALLLVLGGWTVAARRGHARAR